MPFVFHVYRAFGTLCCESVRSLNVPFIVLVKCKVLRMFPGT